MGLLGDKEPFFNQLIVCTPNPMGTGAVQQFVLSLNVSADIFETTLILKPMQRSLCYPQEPLLDW